MGPGYIVDKYGWNGGFLLLIICSTLATILFAFTWNVIAREEK